MGNKDYRRGNLKKKIVILYGGISEEREPSLSSFKSVFDVFKTLEDYEVFTYDFDNDISKFVKYLAKIEKPVIFNCLHGRFGEDGNIQALFDMLGLSYTHSGFVTSAICMDKFFAKEVVKNIGVNLALDVFVKDINDFDIKKIPFAPPFIVKDNMSGSSVGVYFAKDLQELQELVKKLIKEGHKGNLLVEQYIDGREFTVGVLKGKALAVTEIMKGEEIWSYEKKYSEHVKSDIHCLPAKIPSSLEQEFFTTSEKIFEIFRCKQVARVDFMLKDNKIYFLEINTQPGFTSKSLLPAQCEYRGISFDKLCIDLIENT